MLAIMDGDNIIKGSRTRPNPFKLISCKKYGNDTEAPFFLTLSVEALAIIDVHSHCVQTEVIGLLGGLYCSRYRQLNILTAEPCESLTCGTSDLQCEMDPVSQADALEKLTKAGYQVVGWYHSHPTFVPNPSLRDLETQAKYQQLFADGNQPFLSLILNPYSTSNQTLNKGNLVSKYKCLMLSEQISPSQNESRTPFAFNPHLVRREKLFYNLTRRLEELCSKIEGQPSTLCITDKLRGKDMQYLTKISSSLRHHFDVTGLSKIESERLVDQIKDILLAHLRNKSNGR
ncbi:histone H2A deubiquitinase MYSM1-like [Panonychus citri]|uniref:histone H2A deubiquitinase MYSM1-like n=1 Tax=Panonychus citri TaxID=50023 RepID=UPI0023074E93|nr:histone H2A deubiquitinase MYSM1-like [Panonychus citri]